MKTILIENIKYENKKFIISFSSDEINDIQVTENVYVRFNLYRGREISLEEIDEIEYDSLKQIGIDRIVNSKMNQKTENEIRDLLLELDLWDDVIDDVILYLKEYNFINDRLYAETFLKDKMKLNQYGPIKIRYLLRSKKVSESIIDEVLCLYTQEEMMGTMKKVYEKKYHNILPADGKDKNKVIQYFYQKGFPASAVYDLMKELSKNE